MESEPPAYGPPTGRSLTYTPGLDGLRGAALLAILVTHADIGQAPGGFLAVSTFFTLSGFLITALLLGEHAAHGRIDLRAFWTRRARRLLPASLVAIACIAVATVVIGDLGQVRRIRGDAIGTLAYVANWRFLAAGDRYGARFEQESPLLHFWSLAIEEQFYVVFPLIVVGGTALLRRRCRGLGALLASLLILSQIVSTSLAARGATTDRLYFGTDVRAGEMLVGALAAWLWTSRRDAIERRLAPVLRVGAPALAVLMGALVATQQSSDRLWYRGGLVAYACATALVVIGILQPGSPVSRAFSWRPLVWVGVTSYGAYLFHWPVFVWLRSETSLGDMGRLATGAFVSLALATVSYLLVEHPVRSAPTLGRWLTVGAPALLVSIAVVASSVVPVRSEAVDDVALETKAEQLDARLDGEPFDPTRPRVAMFGDSTALSTAIGLAGRDDREGAPVNAELGWANLGCSILSPVTLRARGEVIETAEVCTGFVESWRAAARTHRPDVAVIQVGPWEMCDIAVDGGFASLGDDRIDDRIRDGLRSGVGALLEDVPRVALLTSPSIVPGAIDGRAPDETLPEGDPARKDRFNEILREVAAADPRIAVVEWGAYLDDRPDLPQLRPDGIHLTAAASTAVAEWLGDQLAPLVTVATPR